MTLIPDYIDPVTCAIYLKVPASQVVLLQAYFETYDGLGTVRTLDLRKSLIAILSTPAMLPECLKVLDGVRAEIAWTQVSEVTAEERLRYIGYFKEGKHAQNYSKVP